MHCVFILCRFIMRAMLVWLAISVYLATLCVTAMAEEELGTDLVQGSKGHLTAEKRRVSRVSDIMERK